MCFIKLSQILIDCPKINLELRSQGGITPLMLSVKMGNNRMVQQLIAKSAEITGTDNEGKFFFFFFSYNATNYLN